MQILFACYSDRVAIFYSCLITFSQISFHFSTLKNKLMWTSILFVDLFIPFTTQIIIVVLVLYVEIFFMPQIILPQYGETFITSYFFQFLMSLICQVSSVSFSLLGFIAYIHGSTYSLVYQTKWHLV